jgi:hypothetical protein
MIAHTNDVGLAIRDALGLLRAGVELHDWSGDEPQSLDECLPISVFDDHDPSNLLVCVGEALFTIRIVRTG